MTYTVIDNFNGGMDSRKARISGAPGTLYELINGHITRGGSIERRKKFVSTYNLPTGNTFGLHTANNQLYVFGSAASPGTIPAGVTYQRLVSPTGSTMTALLDAENFDGLIYAIAEYNDGGIYHFYNGNRITDWDSLTAGVASNSAIATSLAAAVALVPGVTASAAGAVVTITAVPAGIPYTISATAFQFGSTTPSITLVNTQANRAAIAEVLATGSFNLNLVGAVTGADNVSSIKVNGVEVLGATVNYTTSDVVTAQAVAQQINSFSTTYTASATNAVVTISAKTGSGATPNGFAITSTVAGHEVISGVINMAGGVTAVTPLAEIYTATIGGTFDPLNEFQIVINGIASQIAGGSSAAGTRAKTFRGKVYSPGQSLVYFSVLNNPTLFEDNPATGDIGSGFINVSNQDTGSDTILDIDTYQGDLAFFARTSIQIWAVDPDPTKNDFIQTISNTGTRSPKSVQPYGNTDLFYLSDAGVRSLRARDASGAAFANDVGVAIYDNLAAFLLTLTEQQIAAAPSVLEPESDRYWIAVGNRIYVFSYFPIFTSTLGVYVQNGGISAWSYYDTGSLQFSDFARVINSLYARAGDTIYEYGGTDGQTYPDAGDDICTVRLPFMTNKQPGTRKQLQSFDCGATNQWQAKLVVDPNDWTKQVSAGIFSDTTYQNGTINIGYDTTHVAPELVCSAAGYAAIYNLAIYYNDTEQKTK